MVDEGTAVNSIFLTYHAISMICLIAGMVAVSGKNLVLIICFVLYSLLNTLLMLAQVIYFLGILKLTPKPNCDNDCFHNLVLVMRCKVVLGLIFSLLNSVFLSAYVICGCYEEGHDDFEIGHSVYGTSNPWVEEPLPVYLPKEKEPPVYQVLPSQHDQI
jgi:hypothetical protein